VGGGASQVRPPAVAGLFYPGDPTELRCRIGALLAAATSNPPGGAAPSPPARAKAIVVPHAGFAYSGAVAATAYAVLGGRSDIARVVLFGPAHRSPLPAVAAPSVDGFATPLGVVPLDAVRRDDLVRRKLLTVADGPHRDAHSLEVQLPFLQVLLGDVPVLPLAVGRVGSDAVVAVLDEVWDDPATLVIISTDLSHYHDHRTASALDRETAAAVVAGRAEALTPERACGATALRGLVVIARRRNRPVELLDLRTSADTAGPADRVVGYGAFAVT
jgi:AmmeMemoRadiSam system protein B